MQFAADQCVYIDLKMSKSVATNSFAALRTRYDHDVNDGGNVGGEVMVIMVKRITMLSCNYAYHFTQYIV